MGQAPSTEGTVTHGGCMVKRGRVGQVRLYSAHGFPQSAQAFCRAQVRCLRRLTPK